MGSCKHLFTLFLPVCDLISQTPEQVLLMVSKYKQCIPRDKIFV